MTDLEKKGYKYSIWGFFFTTIVGVIVLILTFALFQAGGIGIGSFQLYQILVAIIGGIVSPGTIFALNILVERKIIKFKKPRRCALLFGMISAIIGIILIIFSAIWITFMLYYIGDPSTLVHSVAITICLFMGVITLIIATYGGIQNIMYWKQNK